MYRRPFDVMAGFPVILPSVHPDAMLITKKPTAHVVPSESTRSSAPPVSEDLRRYTVIQAKQRLHQAVFRSSVLGAYGNRSAAAIAPAP
jgi:hypothetical protein